MFLMFCSKTPLPKGKVLKKDEDERGAWIYSSPLIILKSGVLMERKKEKKKKKKN